MSIIASFAAVGARANLAEAPLGRQTGSWGESDMTHKSDYVPKSGEPSPLGEIWTSAANDTLRATPTICAFVDVLDVSTEPVKLDVCHIQDVKSFSDILFEVCKYGDFAVSGPMTWKV